MTLSFSVVVTSHNYRQYLGEAIDSVLAQTLPAAQIVVVDDGSSDGSADWLRDHYRGEPRIELIARSNGGQLAAFVSGVAAARGDIVCFLDADDVWQPGHLAALAAAYADAGAPDFVYTNLRLFGGREGLWHDDPEDRDFGLTVLPTFKLFHWYGSPSSALSMRCTLARTLLEVTETFCTSWRTRADDALVYGASLLLARKRYLAEPTVRYRVHGANLWFARRGDRVANLRYAYRRERLLQHYAALAGIGRHSLMKAREEFATKPRPTALEFAMYRRIAWAAPASLGKRVELVLGIRRHYRAARDRGA